MGSICISSEDEELEHLSQRFDSFRADVSESESSSSGFSCRRHYCHHQPPSLTSSPPPVGPDLADIFYSQPPIPFTLPPVGGRYVVTPPAKTEEPQTTLSEVELMKERFAKLLLGEDMSGGGKGVSTALAISNAITNLSATVFGELWKLEALAPQKKAMWCREIDWLLSVSDYIVELIPSVQDFPGGGTFEVMVTRPRSDLYVNLPALKKLDAMLLSFLDGFCDSEFYYVERGIIVADNDDMETFPMYASSGRPCIGQEEKWWLPFPKVPPNGLSDSVRKALQQCRECTNQILKAAMAINTSVLAEMEIPDAYLESLPKSGKACLGETTYRFIATDQFSPGCLLDYLELSSEYTTLEIANRIEAAAHIWKQKYLKRSLTHVNSGKSSWGRKVKGFVSDTEKTKLLAYRAETLLQNLKIRFPGLPQTALNINKLQYNKDVGKSVLESYSRVMESLAFNIMARIDDLLYVDDATKQRTAAESMCLYDQGRFGGAPPKQKRISARPFSVTLPASNHLNQIARSPGGRTHKPLEKSNFSNFSDALDEKLEKITF